MITARIGEYESDPVTTTGGGRYSVLTVSPGNRTLDGETITFHLNGSVQASETDTLASPVFPSFKTLNLSFANLPPTPTPSPTTTPMVIQPGAYSGQIVVPGGTPANAVLTARVGSYESLPAVIQGSQYSNLVVAVSDPSLVGQPVQFFLNGVASTTTDTFQSGAVKSDFALIFVGLPHAYANDSSNANGDGHAHSYASSAYGYAGAHAHGDGHAPSSYGDAGAHAYAAADGSTPHAYANARALGRLELFVPTERRWKRSGGPAAGARAGGGGLLAQETAHVR